MRGTHMGQKVISGQQCHPTHYEGEDEKSGTYYQHHEGSWYMGVNRHGPFRQIHGVDETQLKRLGKK